MLAIWIIASLFHLQLIFQGRISCNIWFKVVCLLRSNSFIQLKWLINLAWYFFRLGYFLVVTSLAHLPRGNLDSYNFGNKISFFQQISRSLDVSYGIDKLNEFQIFFKQSLLDWDQLSWYLRKKRLPIFGIGNKALQVPHVSWNSKHVLKKFLTSFDFLE